MSDGIKQKIFNSQNNIKMVLKSIKAELIDEFVIYDGTFINIIKRLNELETSNKQEKIVSHETFPKLQEISK